MLFENLAARMRYLVPGIWYLGKRYDPLPAGIGFGWPLGGPSVAQGPPKRDAREAQAWIHAKPFVCNKQREIAGWGCGARSAPLRSGDSVHQEIEGNSEVNPGVETAKSLFFGVDLGRGWWRAKRPKSGNRGIGKPETLPLINTDNTDRKKAGSSIGIREREAELTKRTPFSS